MSYASQMFEVWMLREFLHIWAFFHSVSSPRMPFPPTQAYLHLANFSSSKDLNKSFWISSSPSRVLNPVRPRLSCYLCSFIIKHQTNSFRAGLRLAHFGLSSVLHNTAGGKQIFSEWRNGNASISSENIRFQYPWKRMQMNDEVDQKKKKKCRSHRRQENEEDCKSHIRSHRCSPKVWWPSTVIFNLIRSCCCISLWDKLCYFFLHTCLLETNNKHTNKFNWTKERRRGTRVNFFEKTDIFPYIKHLFSNRANQNSSTALHTISNHFPSVLISLYDWPGWLHWRSELTEGSRGQNGLGYQLWASGLNGTSFVNFITSPMVRLTRNEEAVRDSFSPAP